MTSLFSKQRNNLFLMIGDEKWIFMTMFNAEGSGLTMMNLHSLPLRQIFMEEKLCYVCGGITVVLFILSF